jgi:hypothetical protein
MVDLVQSVDYRLLSGLRTRSTQTPSPWHVFLTEFAPNDDPPLRKNRPTSRSACFRLQNALELHFHTKEQAAASNSIIDRVSRKCSAAHEVVASGVKVVRRALEWRRIASAISPDEVED